MGGLLGCRRSRDTARGSSQLGGGHGKGTGVLLGARGGPCGGGQDPDPVSVTWVRGHGVPWPGPARHRSHTLRGSPDGAGAAHWRPPPASGPRGSLRPSCPPPAGGQEEGEPLESGRGEEVGIWRPQGIGRTSCRGAPLPRAPQATCVPRLASRVPRGSGRPLPPSPALRLRHLTSVCGAHRSPRGAPVVVSSCVNQATASTETPVKARTCSGSWGLGRGGLVQLGSGGWKEAVSAGRFGEGLSEPGGGGDWEEARAGPGQGAQISAGRGQQWSRVCDSR